MLSSKASESRLAGFQKDGMCVLRQTQNKSFRILDLLSPCWFQSFPAIFQENSGGPHLKLEAHLPAMDDNTIENSPEGPADRPIQNPNLTDKRTQTSQNCQAQALCCAACVSFNSIICKKNIDDSYDALTRFLPIPSCSYDSLLSTFPVHILKRLGNIMLQKALASAKMRHIQNSAASKPWNTTWRYIINTLSTLHAWYNLASSQMIQMIL